ncbi:MAG: HigA family addiction module antitoxin [Paludibacteraceae bacterium]|nr:HigA family addiction module antitoxin [Paludibacteraceae bacterium]
MNSFYEEHWKQKKILRCEDETPLTPIDELMRRLGISENIGEIYPNVISPGVLIQAVLDDAQITQSELAHQMGVTRTAVHLWIHGQRTLTIENALALEFNLGIPAHILLRMQADFQLSIARHPELAWDQVPRHSTL